MPAPDEVWARVARAREESMPKLGGAYPISGLLRRARRIARLSQRELARRAGLSPSTVTRVETGEIVPTLPAFERMLAVAGLRLVVVDDDGHVVTPMRDIPDTRNGGGWRYPSHLDVILDPRSGEWWGDSYGLARPPETFHRDHDRRRAKQLRSAWEVRVQRFRFAPEPPDVDMLDLLARRARDRPKPASAPPIDTNDWDVDEWSVEDEREWYGIDERPRDDGEPDDGERDNAEPDDGEPDDGEPDDGEPDDGEPDDGERDDGERDNAEPDDGQRDNAERDNAE